MRLKALLICAVLIFSIATAAIANNDPIMRVTFLDVHQGDCTIIRTQEKTILIDGGDDNRGAAPRYIIPYLRREGIDRIHQAIVTHPHRDHFGGFIDLIDAVQIDKVYYSTSPRSTESVLAGGFGPDATTASAIYSQFKEKLTESDIPYIQLRRGELLNWGEGVHVEVVHASLKEDSAQVRNINDESVVIRAQVGQISYLFTGDAERGAENEMISRYGSKLNTTVLKAGHHGSRTSSSHAFLDIVRPSYAVISCGEGNQFRHPHQETLDKFEYYQTPVFRTDIEGTIESHTDGKTVTFVTSSTPLEFTKNPQLLSLTQNSATLQWETNREGSTAIYFGENKLDKSIETTNMVRKHTATLTGLKPLTTYMFRAVTRDLRNPDKEVYFDGTITTKAGSQSPQPTITGITTSFPRLYIKHPFKTIVPVFNPSSQAASNISLTLYHSSMSDSNILGKTDFGSLSPESTVEAHIDTMIGWAGNVELVAVLRKGDAIIDTRSINKAVSTKQIFVDASHGNIDYFTGQFAGMRMDLYQNAGFDMRSLSRGIDYETIKDAFIVILPHPRDEFENSELEALKKFVSNGGSLLVYGQSDFRDLSKPEYINSVMETIGSSIRFNDDQVCHPDDNIGPPWRFFVRDFPNSDITPDVDVLLFRNACSLLSTGMKELEQTENLSILARLDENGYNYNADELDDAFIYPQNARIPLVAAEDLGMGRVVAVGDRELYADPYYSNPSNLSTVEFNRHLVNWLAQSRFRTMREILSYIESLDRESSANLRVQRFEILSEKFFEKAQGYTSSPEGLRYLHEQLDMHNGRGIDSLKRRLNEHERFRQLHQDR